MANRHWEVGANLGDAAPVRIAGGLWFVGTQPASTHVLDTGDGLIMLDSGYRQSLPLVLSHMREAGLNPFDLRYIIHTHGHLDHAGATAELVRLTGAKTVIGAEDRKAVNGALDLTYSREYGMVWDDPFEPDVLVKDGDTIALGCATLQCMATPGHTEGCMSWFFSVEEDGQTYRAALHGGAGFNTLTLDYLDRYGLPHDLRDRYLAAMDRLAEEPVDIFLGNHMQHNRTIEKTRRALSGERLAFVNPDEWKAFALKRKEGLLQLMAREAEA